VFPTFRVRGHVVAIADPINRMLGVSGPSDPRVLAAYRLAGYTPPEALQLDSRAQPETAAERAPRRSKGKERGKAKAAGKVTPLRRRKRGEERPGAS